MGHMKISLKLEIVKNLAKLLDRVTGKLSIVRILFHMILTDSGSF